MANQNKRKKIAAKMLKHDRRVSSERTGMMGRTGQPYHRLEKAFGKPDRYDQGTLDSSDKKVEAQWKMKTPSGPATIYNYKSGPAYLKGHGRPTEKEYDWHIGGKKKAVVPYVKSVLRHEKKEEKKTGVHRKEQHRRPSNWE